MLAFLCAAALAVLSHPHVMPGVVEAAYRGESWEPLNRIIEGRSKYPLEHYMAKWHALSRRLAGALIGAAAATLAARLACGRSRKVILMAVISPALALLAALLSEVGPVHRDYFRHLKMWERTLAGDDPWAAGGPMGWSDHAYGPLFNLLAIPAALDEFAPKVLYALVWAVVLSGLASRNGWVALAVAPMGLWEAACSGRFDILVAICLLNALRDYRDGRDGTAGVWLGVGFLLKFLTLAVLPFLFFDGRRLRWKPALSAITVSAVGFALAIGIWGPEGPFRPLLFNTQRPSGGASLFAFARNLMGFDLDRLSGPIIVMSLTALTAWSVARRPAPIPTSLAATGMILAFHKFGSTAYPVILAVPLAWWATEGKDRTLQRATILYAGWASACLVVTQSIRILNPTFDQPVMFACFGLPTFLVTLVPITVLLRRALAEGQGSSPQPARL